VKSRLVPKEPDETVKESRPPKPWFQSVFAVAGANPMAFAQAVALLEPHESIQPAWPRCCELRARARPCRDLPGLEVLTRCNLSS
jgi:hypothetical protein